MTTLAVLAVLSPIILIALIAAAGALAIKLGLLIARVAFYLTIGGLIGLALWAGQAKANPLHHIPMYFSAEKGQYLADATINGEHIPCIIDSGAANIVLSMPAIAALPQGSIERIVSTGSAGIANGEIVTVWNMIVSDFTLSAKANEPDVINRHVLVTVIPTAIADCFVGNSFLRQFAGYGFVKERPGIGAVLILRDGQEVATQ